MRVVLKKGGESVLEQPGAATLSLHQASAEHGHEAEKQVGIGNTKSTRVGRMLRLDWLGQMTASISWIASVLAYGISSTGDWLQLVAASAWTLANLAAVLFPGAD